MSEIKIIDTGKCTIATLIAPEGSSNFKVEDRLTFHVKDTNSGMDMPDYRMLPEGDWTILGISTQLTEEQWKEVVPVFKFKINDEEGWVEVYKVFINGSRITEKGFTIGFIQAKGSGLSLLEANQCYSVNPYGEKPPHYQFGFEPKTDFSHHLAVAKWREAEANTGRWLILIRS